MMRLIQRRAYQVAHTGIYYGKFLGFTLLNVCNACDKSSALRYYGATQFEMQLLTFSQLQTFLENAEKVGKISHFVFVWINVIDA